MHGKSIFPSTGWLPSNLTDSGAIGQKISLAASVKSHNLKRDTPNGILLILIKRGSCVSRLRLILFIFFLGFMALVNGLMAAFPKCTIWG
jgi:hypothetical protein